MGTDFKSVPAIVGEFCARDSGDNLSSNVKRLQRIIAEAFVISGMSDGT